MLQLNEDKPILTFEDVKECLTEDDLKFLSERPDYSKIAADMDMLIENVAIVRDKLEKRCSHIALNGSLAEARLDAISKALCVYNETKPLWMPPRKL